MKKVVSACLVLLVSVVVFSCSKSKDDSTSASITGKWTFTSGDVKVYSGNIPVYDSTLTGTVFTTWEFKSDGTAVAVDSTGDATNSTYTYNSNTKVLTDVTADSTITYNVVTLTTTQMQLHNEGTTYYLGLPFPYKADLYFKR